MITRAVQSLQERHRQLASSTRILRTTKTIGTLLTLLIFATIAGCGKKERIVSPVAPTVISPDDQHNHASGKDAVFYEIDSCESIRFAPGTYKIPVPKQLGSSGPNSIHLIHGDSEYFRMPWDGTGDVTLRQDALLNIKGTKRFAGFVSGETYILGVGNDNYPESEMKFAVMWVGMIRVK